MTRRQLIAAVAAMAAGPAFVHARQEKKKAEPQLATVTLIIDGMT